MEGIQALGNDYPQSSPRPSASQASSSSTPASRASLKRPRAGATPDGEESEDEPQTQEIDELYVTTRTEVVGIQYYRGLVGSDEVVMLRHEPRNKYDPNAVQVLNAAGFQVGHIPRQVAARIAPLMDAGLISVEGRMIGQNLDGKMRYKLPLNMSIFARASYRPHLEPELAWATPGGRGFDHMRRLEAEAANRGKGKNQTGMVGQGPGNGSQAVDEGMQQILDGLTQVNQDDKAADTVMAALTADLDLSKLPPHPSPPSIESGDLTTNLLSHQNQGLQWMVTHENPKLPKVGEPAVQFWSRQPGERGTAEHWLNVATRTPQSEKPSLGRGGIIADGMGLGKTLTTLALVLATKQDKVAPGFCGATLVVCPLSVLSNWQKQIQDHVAPGKLSLYTYHGDGKGVTATTLAQYDVVLTTYQTLAADAPSSTAPSSSQGKKAKTGRSSAKTGPLLKVKWKRVVADEGHVMKNPKAKMSRAFVSLQAERRWVCTGTPIINAPSDLGSLLACIRVCAPLDQADYFKSLVLRPLKWGSAEASRLLQAIVGQSLLRRTKDSKDHEGSRLITLPPIEYYEVSVKLDPETRKTYDELLAESAKRFQESMRTGESNVNILSMLTRMRQLCLSADLVPSSYLEELRSPKTQWPATQVMFLVPEERERLISKLRQAIADQEECSVCFDILDDPRITDCGHPFCFVCISEVIRRQGLCPMDRHPITTASILELPPDTTPEPEEDTSVPPPTSSAKISELVRYLKAFDASEKTLVFSQFTSFLDRVAAVLNDEGIQFCRFDGTMSAKKRKEVIAQFQEPVTKQNRNDNPVVMLISLKSGAVGLNLTAANNVFLCDPWWQSAIEAQAVDRVHRMGQRRTVRVFQLIAEDTIEAKVLDIQKSKDALVAKAFEHSGTRETKAAKKQARFEELKEILGVK